LTSIVQEWAARLPLRHQGVLVSAVRGCDTALRHDDSKLLSRCLRAEFLVPAVDNPGSYIEFVDEQTLLRRMNVFLNSWDHYPMHFVMHILHAAAVLGYHHPVHWDVWLRFYRAGCKKLHLNPETKEQMDARLTAAEPDFQAAQDARLAPEVSP